MQYDPSERYSDGLKHTKTNVFVPLLIGNCSGSICFSKDVVLPSDATMAAGSENANVAGAPRAEMEMGAPEGAVVAKRPAAATASGVRSRPRVKLSDFPADLHTVLAANGRTLGCSTCRHAGLGCSKCRKSCGLTEADSDGRLMYSWSP